MHQQNVLELIVSYSNHFHNVLLLDILQCERVEVVQTRAVDHGAYFEYRPLQGQVCERRIIWCHLFDADVQLERVIPPCAFLTVVVSRNMPH